MNKFETTYGLLIQPNNTLITENLIYEELKVKCIFEGQNISDEILQESARIAYELSQDQDFVKELFGYRQELVNEDAWSWIHGATHFAGAFDQSGLINLAHAVVYFIRKKFIMGTLTLIGAIPGLAFPSGLVARTMNSGKPIIGTAAKALYFLANKAAMLGKSGGPISKLLAKIIKSPKLAPKFIPWANRVFKLGIDETQILLLRINSVPPNVVESIANRVAGEIVKTFTNWVSKILSPSRAKGQYQAAAKQAQATASDLILRGYTPATSPALARAMSDVARFNSMASPKIISQAAIASTLGGASNYDKSGNYIQRKITGEDPDDPPFYNDSNKYNPNKIRLN